MVPSLYGRILQYLRCMLGIGRKELASRLGWSEESRLGRLENGKEPLSREALEAILPHLPCAPEAIDVLLSADELIATAARPEPPSPVALTEEERWEVYRAALAAAWSLADALAAGLAQGLRQTRAARARQEAEEAFSRLASCAPAERQALPSIYPEYRTWALAVRVAEASVEAAADDAERALELAEFACSIAERVEEEPGFRLRLEGHCLGRRANAWRVANDFDRAEEDFTRAWDLWRAGADADPPLLAEWQMLSLEASLRQEQHLFPKALDLLERAKAASRGDRAAEGRILLKREHVYERMGDIERALAVLVDAAPVIEGCGDARLAFLHRFKIARSLVQRERFAEVAALWPRVVELAAGQGKKLERLRVRWVEGSLRAGLGERLEAMAIFVEVQREFTRLRLPYDAALVSLELAVLWLEAGRTAEVRELALEMAWIFKTKKIAREALAALRLFCDTAGRDAATLELARPRGGGEGRRAARILLRSKAPLLDQTGHQLIAKGARPCFSMASSEMPR
jgi:tetratricopeptide (TPR) repeat protein